MRKGVVVPAVSALLIIAVFVGKPYFQKQAVITTAQDAIKRHLVDPGSAEFKIEKVVYSSISGTVCGEVNSKNRAGGYVGFRRFIWNVLEGKESIAVSEERIQDDFSISDWAIFCKPQ
jgi:hypothetical protein